MFWYDAQIWFKIWWWNCNGAFKDGVTFPNSTGLVVVDCNPGVGNFMEAFTQVIQQNNVAALYVPIFGDMEHRDWFDQFWSSELCQQFQEGKLAVPGCERQGGFVQIFI